MKGALKPLLVMALVISAAFAEETDEKPEAAEPLVIPAFVLTQGWNITGPKGWTMDGSNGAFLGTMRSPTPVDNPGPEGSDNEIRAWIEAQNQMASATLAYRRHLDDTPAKERFDAWLKLLSALGSEVQIFKDERLSDPPRQIVELSFKIGTETWRQRIRNTVVSEPKPGMVSLVVGSHEKVWDIWQETFQGIEGSLGRLE